MGIFRYLHRNSPDGSKNADLTSETLRQTPVPESSESDFPAIIRSESEFSLGLNRSNSFADHMNELGLCDAGHTAFTLARLTIYGAAIVYVFGKYTTTGKANE